MRVLIVKTSSLGDVIHTLPALTDAGKMLPDVRFDWVVEENFAAIPAWHPLVNRVIPVAWRRWRKKLFAADTRKQWQYFYRDLRSTSYDLIIDAQGLVKSGFLARAAAGKTRCGFNWQSAREPLASIFYNKKYAAEKKQHAIHRVRKLFSSALGYLLPNEMPDYGIDRHCFVTDSAAARYIVFLHGTTWATKHWPEFYWVELAKLANKAGYTVKLFWGNAEEQQRAQRIAAASSLAEVMPRLGLTDIAAVLAGAKAIVAVDTGLGHLAAALDVPTVSLYGPTHAALTGMLGRSQVHLSTQFSCAPCLSRECHLRDHSSLKLARPIDPPCFTDVTPAVVWGSVTTLL